MCYRNTEKGKVIVPRLSRRGTSWKKGRGAGGATLSSPQERLRSPPTPQNNGAGALLLGVRIFPARNLSKSQGMANGPRVDRRKEVQPTFLPTERQELSPKSQHRTAASFLPPSFYPTSGTVFLSLIPGWKLHPQADLQEVGTGSQCHQCQGMKAAFQPTLALSLAPVSSWTTSR